MTSEAEIQGRGSQGLEFYRALLTHSSDLVMVVGPDGLIRYSSPSVQRVLGYAPDERKGRSFFELIHPDDLAKHRAAFAESMEEPGSVVTSELRVRHKDGGWRVVRGIARNLMDTPEIGGLLVNARDITDLKEAEAEAARAHALVHEVVTHAPIVLWKVDADGVFQLSEGRGLATLGLEPGQVVGRNVFEVYAGDEATVDAMRRVLDGEPVRTRLEVEGATFETHIRPIRDGDQVVGAVGGAQDVTQQVEELSRAEFQARLLANVGESVIATDPDGTINYWNEGAEDMYGWTRDEVVGGNIMDVVMSEGPQESTEEIMATLTRGERWAGEQPMRRKDGSRFPALVTIVPVVKDGELDMVIGVSTDLTEQKRLEDQLRQAQKMEAVGQLAGGIAHEFNNLLTSIGGYAALAVDRTQEPNVADDLREILDATDRARGLADKLLAFSRRRSARLEPVDLDGLLKRNLAMLKRAAGEAVRVRVRSPEHLWLCTADPSLLEQAIANLVLNARDAMPQGGELTLATERVSLDAARAEALEVDLSAGDYVRLTVEDTGQGIDPAIEDKIFEPFFTTKPVGQGTGLGLGLVFGAVKQSDGAVTVESEPGGGTRFTLYLPRADKEAGGGAGAAPEPEPEGIHVILLVEDEAAVLTLARRVLEREGHRVLEASSGEEAHRLIASEGQAVDLVVTDVIMPEMSGPELVQRLRKSDPEIRSLFMSGYAADELERRGLDQDTEFFLPKPFTPSDLTEAVARALRD